MSSVTVEVALTSLTNVSCTCCLLAAHGAAPLGDSFGGNKMSWLVWTILRADGLIIIEDGGI